ncbi:LSU ribosomal protein L22P [Malonomonas rubra DSM 5091]|uniref:Large ribosomal subunit protein uL22 n=1 Tax=Malonomonas rubra DSM 5091 TaxID=1122189 RepID=A0A1M6MSQ2_MALRU|nr:50S ribosomal protein L22 [Malonomonas rubra]SHJ86501.1 LSU ribosomal protein L22P [Malonomonas rubra DSM 5091]
METQAKLRNVRLSPQKARLVVDMVRGKGIQDALNILQFAPQKTAPILSKLLKSAVANAEQKGISDVDALFVKTVMVDQGPVLKRFMPRAQGRASRIRKPTSHITVVLDVK